jgi:hypothetical protein
MKKGYKVVLVKGGFYIQPMMTDSQIPNQNAKIPRYLERTTFTLGLEGLSGAAGAVRMLALIWEPTRECSNFLAQQECSESNANIQPCPRISLYKYITASSQQIYHCITEVTKSATAAGKWYPL